MDDFEPIEQGRRYVFGETDSFYGVWDRQAGTGLLEQFPLTDEGFERAAARLDSLKRRDRRDRGVLLYALWWVIVGGAVAMVFGGVLELLQHGLGSDFLLGSVLSFTIGNLGYNVAIGGLVLLVALTLIRRETRRRAVPANGSAEPIEAGPATGSSSSFLWWTLVIALGVWVLSAIATQLFFPLDFGFGDMPSMASRVGGTVESLAFRVWVAALAIWWARRLLSQNTAEDREAAE